MSTIPAALHRAINSWNPVDDHAKAQETVIKQTNSIIIFFIFFYKRLVNKYSFFFLKLLQVFQIFHF
jgi:hypothetical protein